MKKIVALFLCFTLFSCDDGDLDIPAFDFEDIVHGCDIKNDSYTLFRLGTAESLIVTLSDDDLKNEVTTEPILVSITSNNVIYRTFSSQVSDSYFCEDIPPLEPKILSNWTGVSGNSNVILIETTEELDDSNVLIGYKHSISFQNLKVENGNEFLAFEEGTFGEYVIYL